MGASPITASDASGRIDPDPPVLLFPDIGFPVHSEYTLRHDSPHHRLRLRESPSIRMVLICVVTAALFAGFFTRIAQLASGATHASWQLYLGLFIPFLVIGLVGGTLVRRRLRQVGDLAVFDDTRQTFWCVGLVLEALERDPRNETGEDFEIEAGACALSVREIAGFRVIRATARAKGFATRQDHIRFAQFVLDRKGDEPIVIAASEGKAKSLQRVARRLAGAMDVPLDVVRVPKHLMPTAQQFERFLRPTPADIRRAQAAVAAGAEDRAGVMESRDRTV